MNPIKMITLTLAAITTTALMLSTIQLLLRQVRSQSENDFRIKSAYGIWFASLAVAAILVSAKSILFLDEAADNLYKIMPVNLYWELAKTASLYMGLSVVWFLLWFFVAKAMAVTTLGMRREAEEMDLNNACYFLIRGLIFIGLVFCLSPVLDMVFRLVLPNVPLTFYH
ncbi:hypothetical protein ACFGVR_14930 [Mucilaginibacter sp. AW1-3]